MPRASWGGQQDLSGLFSSLINADFADIKAGIERTQSDARDEQGAKDVEMQAKWKAGKISDEQWLAYIRGRVKDTTDPQQRAQWEQILLENQDAISDAQWETRFQENKITVGQLIQHYRGRMSGVATNSPAYRDLAGRMADLVDFQRQGGTYARGGSGGRSGGSGGSGGGGGGSTKAGEAAQTATLIQGIVGKGLEGGPTDAGYRGGEVYDTSGPNIVDVLFGSPASNTPSAVWTTGIDGLQATQFRLEGVFKFMEENPNATIYTPPGGGVAIPLTPDNVRAMDNQYLRTTETLSLVYKAKGDNSAYENQRAKEGAFVSGPMRDHNAAVGQPNIDAVITYVKSEFARAAATADPQQRSRIYEAANSTLDNAMQSVFPETIKTKMAAHGRLEGTETGGETKSVANNLENMLPDDMNRSIAAIRLAGDIGAHPYAYTDQEVSDAYDTALEAGPIGTGAARLNPSDLWGGNANSTMGSGQPGVGDAHAQYYGLKFADAIQRGIMSPDDLPPNQALFTYQYNPNTKRVEAVEALAVPTASGAYKITPAAADQFGNLLPASNGVEFAVTIGGKTVTAWAATSEAPPSQGYVYRFKGTVQIKVGGQQRTFREGDIVPSSVLAQLNPNGVRQYENTGLIGKANLPGVRQANIGGRTWFYDQRSNSWSPTPPWNLEMDPTDPNSVHVADPKYKADGTIDTANTDGPSTQISMMLRPGMPGFPIPFDPNTVTPQQMQEYINAEIASGHINPDDYQIPSADGTAMVPMGGRLNTLYYDKADDMAHATGMSSQGGLTPEDIQQEHERKIVGEWERRNVGDRHGFWRVADAEKPSNVSEMIGKQVKQFASSLGIRTGNLDTLNQRYPGAPAGFQRMANADPENPYHQYGPGLRDLQSTAMLAQQSRKKSQALPRLAPLPPINIDPVRRIGLGDKPVEPPPPPPISLVGVTGKPLTAQQRQRARNFRPDA